MAEIPEDLKLKSKELIATEASYIEWGASAEQSVNLVAKALLAAREESEQEVAHYKQEAEDFHASAKAELEVSKKLNGQLISALADILRLRERIATLTAELARADQMRGNLEKENALLKEQLARMSAPVSDKEHANYSGSVDGYTGLYDRWDINALIAARAKQPDALGNGGK